MTLHIREGFVSFGAYQTWFRMVEPSTARAKIPLLCLHGGPGIPHDYLEPLEDLARGGRPVVFYDQLGCGNSDVHADPSLCTVELFVRELATLRESLCLTEVHLFGHSWGGMLAMEYLVTRPAGVASLVAASTLASMPHLIAEIARLRDALGDYGDDLDEALAAFNRAHVCRLDAPPDCVYRSYAKHQRNSFVTRTMFGPHVFQVDGSLREWDLSQRLHEITLPVLVTCGRFDEATPEIARHLANSVPGAEFKVFEHSSHVPHIEEPEAFLATVEEFLSRAERSNDPDKRFGHADVAQCRL